MMWFKSCPRCETGDVILQRDVYGWAFQCLHCGFMKDVSDAERTKSVLKGLDKDLERNPQPVAIVG